MQPTLVSSKISKAPLVCLVFCRRPFLPIPRGNRVLERKDFREFTNIQLFGHSSTHLLFYGESERGNLEQRKIFQGLLPHLYIQLVTSDMEKVNPLGHI